MGSAVENVENIPFVDRIRWSKKTYTLRMLLEFRQPPCIVHVPEGYRGSNDVENLPPGLIVRINSVFAERRIFARCADGRVFSIPETFPIKFEVIKKNRKRSKAKRLDEILRNYRPPIAVALDRKNNRWTFRNGKTIQSEDSLGTMVLLKAYFEHFARVNQLIDGAIDRRVFLIPLYLDLDVRLAEGLRNENTSEFGNLMNMYTKAIGSIDYSAYTGLNAILEFDPSAGSNHPLATSRLPSMDNSIRAVSDTRTGTDEATIGMRGSMASGSQGQSTAGRSRSEDPRQGRRRAKSEDHLAIITLEGTGKRQRGKSESKTLNISSDGSVSEESSPGEVELMKEAGRGGTQLSRRRGRSAEELQARRPTRSRESPEVASLDRLPEVKQASISRRPEVQNVRHVKENQNGSSGRRGGGGGTGREEGQSRDDATIVSNRGRSRNPVVVHPTPKPRKAGSRGGQSENSVASAPQPVPTGKTERQGHSKERSVALNRSQDWTSSPAPNYHIHINIQSPNSPPIVSGLDGHSTVQRTTTAATTGQPVRPFPDNVDSTYLDERQDRQQTFPRQDSSRPDVLPQPVRHTFMKPESRRPKAMEAVRQTHLRQDTYQPRSPERRTHPRQNRHQSRSPERRTHPRQDSYPLRIAGPVYIRHPPPLQPTKLAEPIKPIYIRQETYPRETVGWNNSPTRRLFRELVPTMFKRPPSQRRSTSGRVYVSSVSCTGSDSVDLQGKKNFTNEGKRSHGLRSKVIRLKNGEDSEIAEMEVKEFYGRTSTIRSTGNYVNPHHNHVTNGDVNNNNFTLSPGEYNYPTLSSVFDEDRSPQRRSTKRKATKIEVPATLDITQGSYEATMFSSQERSIRVDRGRKRDQQGSRHWVLRSGMQKPDNRSPAPRQSLGTTIAV